MVALCEVTKVGPTHMSVARRAPLPPAPPQRAYTHVLSGIRARSLDEIFANIVTWAVQCICERLFNNIK